MQSEKDQEAEEMMMKQKNGNSNDNNNNNNGNENNKAPQKCPRCESLNTKFCYYNNYSLSQPRFFCKTCRRYWTQGGTLRNVPVGGGCRKGKRARTTTGAAIAANMASTSSTTSSSEGGGENFSRQLLAQASVSGGGGGDVLPRHQNQTNNPQSIIGSGLMMRPVEPFGSQFYHQSSYLPSFADMNQQLAGMITAPSSSSASTLSLLEGFNFAAFGSQQHHQQHQIIPPSHQFFDPSDDHHQTTIDPTRSVINSNNHDHQYWRPQHQSNFGSAQHHHVNNDSETITTPTHHHNSTVDWTVNGAANVDNSGDVVPANDSNHHWPTTTTHHDLSGSYGPPP